MKILKPGKVEMRQFVCPRCGCEFLASMAELESMAPLRCPEAGCDGWLFWELGEPYEEDA